MAVRDLVVRTRELGGQLVTIGGNASRGITIEQPSLQADAWGPSAFSCVLKRDPRVQWADLQAYAPVIVEAQGQVVWRGRIKGTPMTDGGTARQIALNCEGQQFHLDDDVYQRMYVHTSLTDFKDARAFPDTPLLTFRAGYQTEVGVGGILLAWPNAQVVVSATAVGVTLDLGPSGLCKRFVISVSSSNNTTDQLFIRGSDAADGGSSPGDTDVTIVNNAGPNVASGTFTTARRYIHLFFDDTGSGTFTPSADVWIRILSFLAVGDTAYESGNLSILKASDVVLDGLARATLLLSADRSLITPTSFNIPEFTMSGPATPREVITAANAYHGYQFRVRADNRPEYRPLPSTPSVQVGEDSRFDEASAGDASEIYTTVVVTYTDASGNPQSVTRSQPASAYVPSAIQPTNSGAEVDTSNWAGSGTLARTTVAGEFSAGVGGFKTTATAALAVFTQTSAWAGGAFLAGQTYELTIDLRTSAGPYQQVRVSLGGSTLAVATLFGDGSFHPATLSWVQPSATAPTIAVYQYGNGVLGTIGFFDNLILRESAPTIINRWGFRRTKILDTNMTLTDAGAQQIADIFLAAHRTTPLKGKLTIPGHGRAIDVPSGRGLSCAELLGRTCDLVRIAHLVDPDTGKLGRIGRIAGATHDPVSDSVVLDMDSTDQNFESLLARLSIVAGQVRS